MVLFTGGACGCYVRAMAHCNDHLMSQSSCRLKHTQPHTRTHPLRVCRSETGLDRKQHVQIAPETGKGLGVVSVSALSDAVERSVVVAFKQYFSLKMTILS